MGSAAGSLTIGKIKKGRGGNFRPFLHDSIEYGAKQSDGAANHDLELFRHAFARVGEAPSDEPSIPTIPPMSYIAVRGKNNPSIESDEHQNAMHTLATKQDFTSDFSSAHFHHEACRTRGNVCR